MDADWNEMEDIRKFELETFLKWFVGDGVPEGSNAFEIKRKMNPDKAMIKFKSLKPLQELEILLNPIGQTRISFARTIGFHEGNNINKPLKGCACLQSEPFRLSCLKGLKRLKFRLGNEDKTVSFNFQNGVDSIDRAVEIINNSFKIPDILAGEPEKKSDIEAEPLST
ncbi:MAG: hypothetical protein ACFFCW_34810, partial [Candidatus Hodarchaeota archaeon]